MKLLLIDDEEDIRKLGKLGLEAGGRFRTTVAASAPEGLELAHRDPPGVIVMDVMMPGMDGLAALAAIRSSQTLRRVPVILMSAKAQPYDIARYLELGATGVIVKPFDPLTLAAEVRAILEQPPY